MTPCSFFVVVTHKHTGRQTILCAWSVSTLALGLHQESCFMGDYKVRSTHPISFVCSVSFSRRHISSPHQPGNRREAAGEKEEVGGLGIWSKARCLIRHMKPFHHLLILFWHLIWWSVGSGGGARMCVSTMMVDGWDDNAEPIQMPAPSVIFNTVVSGRRFLSRGSVIIFFHITGVVYQISIRCCNSSVIVSITVKYIIMKLLIYGQHLFCKCHKSTLYRSFL